MVTAPKHFEHQSHPGKKETSAQATSTETSNGEEMPVFSKLYILFRSFDSHSSFPPQLKKKNGVFC